MPALLIVRERDGKLYRVAQDCNGCYGKRLFKVEVREITPSVYSEGDSILLLDKNTHPKLYKHTYNEIEVGGMTLAAFDGQYKARLSIGNQMKTAIGVFSRLIAKK